MIRGYLGHPGALSNPFLEIAPNIGARFAQSGHFNVDSRGVERLVLGRLLTSAHCVSNAEEALEPT